MKVKTLFSHALRSSPWPLDSVKSLYHIDGGGCDYAKGTGSSAQRLHAILADRSCRTQGPGDAPPVFTGASCAQGYQRRPCAVHGSPSCPGPRQGSQFFLRRQPQRMISSGAAAPLAHPLLLRGAEPPLPRYPAGGSTHPSYPHCAQRNVGVTGGPAVGRHLTG